MKKFAWGNQNWLDYFWLFYLASRKTDYNLWKTWKIIDSDRFLIKTDFNRLKSNWLSSVMLRIIGNRWFSHWLSWVLLKTHRNQSIQNWRSSDERQYIGKQHWWMRFSHPYLTSFSWIWNKGTLRSIMSHCLIRDRHALISVLSMVSSFFHIFSSTGKPHVDEYLSLAEWSLGLVGI